MKIKDLKIQDLNVYEFENLIYIVAQNKLQAKVWYLKEYEFEVKDEDIKQCDVKDKDIMLSIQSQIIDFLNCNKELEYEFEPFVICCAN